MTLPVAQSDARPTILRLLAAMAAGNQLWEVPHVPLYTLWVTGSPGEIAYPAIKLTGSPATWVGKVRDLALHHEVPLDL